MIRKAFVLSILAAVAISLSGCHTVYNTSKGAAEGAVTGAKQDYEDVQKVDTWMKRNLW